MYGADGRAQYSPPRRPIRRCFSPRRSYDEDKYIREDERSLRIDRKYGYDKDLSRTEVRLPGRMDRNRGFFDIVERDRDVIDNSRSRSPWMMEKRDLFERDLRGSRFYSYDVKDKYKYVDGFGSIGRVYDDGLPSRSPTSTKYQLDHFSEGPRKSDGIGDKDDNHGIGGSRLIRGDENEFYQKTQNVDTNRTGLSSNPLKFSATEPFLSHYDKGRKIHSDLYNLGHGGDVSMARSYLNAGDGSSQISLVTARYSTDDVDKQGYFHFKNDNQLDVKGIAIRDEEKHYLKTKDEDFQFKDWLHLDKLGIERPVGRYRNKKDDYLTSSQDILKTDSENGSLPSRSKEYLPMSSSIFSKSFTGCVEGNIHPPSQGIQPGMGLVSDSLGFDGYIKTRHTPLIQSGSQFDDIKSGTRPYSGLAKEKSSDILHHNFGTNTEHRDIGDQHGVVQMQRFTPSNFANESSYLKLTDNNSLWEKPTSSIFSKSTDSDSCRSLYPRNRDPEELHSGISHLPSEREVYLRCQNIRAEEHSNDLHASSPFLVERLDNLPMKDDISWGRRHGSKRKDPDLVDLTSEKSSKRGLRDEYITDDMLYEHGIGITISNDETGARKIYNLDAGVDVYPVIFSKNRKPTNNKQERFRNVISHDRSLLQISPSHLSVPHKFASGDIKKRLGPVPQNLHVSRHLLKKLKPSLRKRLGLVSQKHLELSPEKKSTLPWLKNIDSSKEPSIEIDLNRKPNQCGENLEECIRLSGPEPPETSEDFKHMVQSAFFKFLKQINETPGKRKQYMEHGKEGCLKCIVCGSNSDGFVDTESLVTHAFTFKKIGLRSQHLGLYKALCVLMGWVIAEEPSSDWHCEIMSNAEALALREDLIIWPPVIICQNRSIDSQNFSERILVSTETLAAKLRGRGFGGILKVSTGKPANQSVMIVTFNGTLSGLKEAAKLHHIYAENGHGRVDLQQHMCNKPGEGIQVEEEDVLYGYLGTVDDLGKLDFDTKKRCVVRSRKEMLSIANAC